MHNESREAVVEQGKRFARSRGGKNSVLYRYTHSSPIVCALDKHIKDSCLHRDQPKEGTPCANCMMKSLAVMSRESVYGGKIKFTKSVVNQERRDFLVLKFRHKRRVRESMRANQRQIRYAKRRRKQGRAYISKPTMGGGDL